MRRIFPVFRRWRRKWAGRGGAAPLAIGPAAVTSVRPRLYLRAYSYWQVAAVSGTMRNA